MNKWPVHATWNGPIVMIGFGSIGRGTLPLILRHIACDKSKITVIDPKTSWSHLLEKQAITHVREAITKQNYRSILEPLLTSGPGQALIVNLSVDVGSIDIIKLAHDTNSLCLDTVNEPWPGFYYNAKLDNADRTNYAVREDLLALRRALGTGPTAVSCCGANPGMVSWLVKRALLDMARDIRLTVNEPTTREAWAKLMKKLRVKGIHIAERDTQRAKNPKPLDVNAFHTLVKTASEFVRRSEQQLHAELHQSITVTAASGRVTVNLDIVPDEDNPYATLRAYDDGGDLLAEVRTAASFKLNRLSAERWAASNFEKPK